MELMWAWQGKYKYILLTNLLSIQLYIASTFYNPLPKNILLEANILAKVAVSRCFFMSDLDILTSGTAKVNKFNRFLTGNGLGQLSQLSHSN